jgi:hypothetical protein
MGYSTTDRDELSDRAAYRDATGTTFAHTATMASTPTALRHIHESMDPKSKNTLGQQIRECRDSEEHPNALPIVVGFDETGSMGTAPQLLQKKLATLKGATLRMGLTDAQLCFAAYGDAQNDEVAPCQVGQFESGIEMEDFLNNLYLEKQGGGNSGETPGLLLYFLANFTALDSLAKRGKKGYIVLTGDECPLPYVTRDEVERYIGPHIQSDLTIKEVVKEAQKSFEIYFFLVNNHAAAMQGSEKVWQNLLGADHVIPVQSLDNISEQIALLIAQLEGTIDSLDAGAKILIAEGADPKNVARASQELAHYTGGKGNGNVAVRPTGAGALPVPAAAGKTTRL